MQRLYSVLWEGSFCDFSDFCTLISLDYDHAHLRIFLEPLFTCTDVQSEIFQDRGTSVELGHFDKPFVKNAREKRPSREKFCGFFSKILSKLHFE